MTTVRPRKPGAVAAAARRKGKGETVYEIKDVKTQEVFRGHSVSSIARRVWGRDVKVVMQQEVSGLYEVMGPVVPSNPSSRPVLATIWAADGIPFDTADDSE